MSDAGLTHVDAAGAARMVDVTAKPVSPRTATASGAVRLSPAVVALLRGQGVPKGDALAVARIAGIAAAKRTPDLVPLCHPIAIHGVTLELAVEDDAVRITATVRTADRTGVEMEALTCVSVAALTLVDMVKAVDPTAVIADVRVETKTGGASGDWHRPPPPAPAPSPSHRDHADIAPPPVIRARVVTVSTRAAAGGYDDRSGPVLVDGLRALGCAVDGPEVVADGEPVRAALRAAVQAGYDVVLTTGGTGITPTDRTPEMTRELLDFEVPGIAEALRQANRSAVPTAVLSRGLAGVAGGTLVVNLPGSPGGCRDGLEVLGPLLGHAVEQIAGSLH